MVRFVEKATLFKVGETYQRPFSKRKYTCLFDDGVIVLFKTTGLGTEGSQSWHRGLSGERNFLNQLKIVPVVHEGWVNIYSHSEVSQIWETKEKADMAAAKSARVACIPIKFTEGEGL